MTLAVCGPRGGIVAAVRISQETARQAAAALADLPEFFPSALNWRTLDYMSSSGSRGAAVTLPVPLDWDMSTWEDEDGKITVAGLVMAVEGCGDNDDPVAVVTPDGRRLAVAGVARTRGAVYLVVVP